MIFEQLFREFEQISALGDACVDWFLDGSSTLPASTNKGKPLNRVFLYFMRFYCFFHYEDIFIPRIYHHILELLPQIKEMSAEVKTIKTKLTPLEKQCQLAA